MESEKVMRDLAMQMVFLYTLIAVFVTTGALFSFPFAQSAMLAIAVLLVPSLLFAFKAQFAVLRCFGINGLALGFAMIGGLTFTYLVSESGRLHLVSLVPLAASIWMVARASVEVKKLVPGTSFLLRFGIYLVGPICAFGTTAFTELPIDQRTKAMSMVIGALLMIAGPRLVHTALARNGARSLKNA